MTIRKLTEEGKVLSAAECAGELHEQKQRHTAGIIITVIFVLAVAGGILFLTFSKTMFPAIYTTGKLELKTPANAEVLFRVGCGPVKTGDKLAELLVRNGTDLNFVNEFNRLAEKKLAFGQLEAALTREYDDFLKEDQALVQLADTTGIKQQKYRNLREQKRTLLESERARLARTERLWNLDAVKSTELENARQAAMLAEHEYQNAELELNAATTSLALLEKQLSVYRDRMAALKRKSEEITRENQQFLAASGAVFRNIRKTPDGLLVSLYSPIAGTILSPTPAAGQALAAGDTVAAVAQPKNCSLSVYLPASYFRQLSPNDRFCVDFGEGTFEAGIKYIYPELVGVPRGMRHLVKNPDVLLLKVDLAVPAELTSIPDGLPGKAFIR